MSGRAEGHNVTVRRQSALPEDGEGGDPGDGRKLHAHGQTRSEHAQHEPTAAGQAAAAATAGRLRARLSSVSHRVCQLFDRAARLTRRASMSSNGAHDQSNAECLRNQQHGYRINRTGGGGDNDSPN